MMTEVQQTKASTLKTALYDWREIVLQVNNVLNWEQEFYPGVIAGVVTFFYFCLWLWDPTLISFVSLMGLFITTVDYVGPKVLNQVYGPDSWTSVKERQYENSCENMVSVLDKVENFTQMVREARSRKPIFHFVGTLMFFLSLAALGNRINNFFLAYLTTLGVMMLPGLHKRGILQQYTAQISVKIAELIKGKDHMKKVE